MLRARGRCAADSWRSRTEGQMGTSQKRKQMSRRRCKMHHADSYTCLNLYRTYVRVSVHRDCACREVAPTKYESASTRLERQVATCYPTITYSNPDSKTSFGSAPLRRRSARCSGACKYRCELDVVLVLNMCRWI